MLFLSQPVGVGFSYQKIANGSFGPYTDTFVNDSKAAPATGTWPILDPIDEGEIDTTDLAAIAAWHILQGFLSGIPKLAGKINVNKKFNLWTESYGGHYGPAFFDYFYKQNVKIESGEIQGYPLTFNSLGIINGIVDSYIQTPYYPEFAMNNTYGIKAYNDTVYNYAKFATYWPNGCLAAINTCITSARIPDGVEEEVYGHVITNTALSDRNIAAVCQEAADMCRDNVENPYYVFSGRNTYDIRAPSDDPTPPLYFEEYLNQAKVQDAIGVSVNYTASNDDIFGLFQVSQLQ